VNAPSHPAVAVQPSRRRRYWRVGLWTLGIAFVVGFAGLAGLLAWAGAHPGAPRWVVAQLHERVPELKLTGITGTFSSGVRIDGLVWTEENGVRVEVRDLAVQMQVLSLLGLHAAARLQVGAVDWVEPALAPPRDERAPPPLPDLRHPGRLTLTEVRVGQLRWLRESGSEPVVIWDQLEIEQVESGRSGLTITALELQRPEGNLRLGGTIEPWADWVTDLKIEASQRLPDELTVHATAELTGTVAGDWRIHANLTSTDPAAAKVEIVATGHDLRREPPAGQAEVTIHAGLLRPWWPEAPEVRIEGKLEVAGSHEQGRLTGQLDAILDTGETWQWEPTLSWNQDQWTLADSPLQQADGAIRLVLGGNLELTSEWIPQAFDLQLTGELTEEALGELAWLRVRSGAATLNWNGDRIDGKGSVSLGEDLAGQLDWRAEVPWHWGEPVPDLAIDVAWQALVLQGWTSPAGQARVTGTAEAWTVAGAGEWRSPEVPDQTGQVNFEVQGNQGDVSGLSVDAELAGNVLQAEGRLAPEWDLQWKVEMPALETVRAGWSGRMASVGSLRGSQASPDLVFTLEGADLQGPGVTVARVEGAGTLVAAAVGARTATLQVEGIQVGDWSGERLDVRLSGEGLRLEVEADLVSSTGVIRVVGEGLGTEQGWSGQVRRADWQSPVLGDWQLAAPVAWEASLAHLEVAAATLQRVDGSGAVTAQGRWALGEGIRAGIEVDLLPWAILQPWLPAGFDYAGEFAGAVRLDWPTGAEPEISWTGRLGPGSWSQRGGAEETAMLLRWRAADWAGRWAEGRLEGEGRFNLHDGGQLHARFAVPLQDLPDRPAEDEPWQASLVGDFAMFELIPALIPDLAEVTGKAEVDLALAGTRRDPRLRGTLRLIDGSAAIPRLGLRLTGLGLTLAGGWDQLDWQAEATSGTGRAELAGSLRIADGRLSGTAKLTGDNVELVRLPEAEIRVSPQLDLHLDGRAVRVAGTVTVPHGRLRPPDWSEAILASSDEIVVGTAASADPVSPWSLQARVTLRLGDVSFKGYGLQTKVRGELTATAATGQDPRATGELRVEDGRYSAWGQTLEIERGRMIFSGGLLAEPGVDIRAVRRVREVVVGVDVRGPLHEPALHLFSEPAMPNTELLSWLLFGTPLAQASGADQQLISRTANTVGLAGGEFLLRQVGRRLGLDEVKIEQTDDSDMATVVVGRYLSPRLFVAYGLGIFEPTSLLRLRFQIDQRWTIEAEAGERVNSTDLRYSFER